LLLTTGQHPSGQYFLFTYNGLLPQVNSTFKKLSFSVVEFLS